MADEIRPLAEDEFDAGLGVFYTAYGLEVDDDARARLRAVFELDRSIGVFDAGRVVGTAAAYSFDLTLPGLRSAAAAGVSFVGVLPTHRRRGIQRRMMRRQLDDIAERGEALAVLLASEAQIYGRYGYGPATWSQTAIVRSEGTALEPEPAVGGRFRLLDTDELLDVVPPLHDAFHRARPGTIGRSRPRWETWAENRRASRRGGTHRFVVVHEDDVSVADGYAAYRIRGEGDGNTAVVEEVVSTEGQIEAAMVRYLLDLDLVSDVRFSSRPLDDPLRARLVDTRRYVTKRVADWLWLRVVDVPAALAARAYTGPGRLVLGVVDSVRPVNDGTYVLEVDDDGSASCNRAAGGEEPEVRLPVDSLAAAYLGGTGLTTLADAGRAAGDRPALRRGDAMFASDPSAFCDLFF